MTPIVNVHPDDKNTDQSTSNVAPRVSTALKPDEVHKASTGYSPFIKDDSKGSFPSKCESSSKNKYCVIFGTSITMDVDGDKLSRHSRKVINCSTSGAKISDVSDDVRDFCVENPGITDCVDKVIVCLGTNDIKFFNGQKYDVFKRFRAPLTPW